MSEPEITTVSKKGQVVIPRGIREKMKLVPKTRLLVYDYDDTLILKKLIIPDVEIEMKALWKEIDKRIDKKHRPTQREVDEEIHAYRKEKKAE